MKPLYITAGWLCLAIGLLGIFFPLVPTTPFVLLAAFCFSKGSVRLHRWLLNQRTFGPIIRDWHQHGMIRLHIKWLSTIMIAAMISYPVLFGAISIVAKIAAVGVGIGVLGFIWSRPSKA